MADYSNWIIDGKTPTNIEDIDIDLDKRIFTFNCVADIRNLDGEDPRTEINIWEEIACYGIENKQLLFGGSRLQRSGGKKIFIQNGDEVWIGAILQPKFKVDENSHIFQKYSLTAIIEGTSKNFTLYKSPFNLFSNITYNYYTDKSPNPINNFLGKVLGEMVIESVKSVNQVILYGSGNCCPAWIECNGTRYYWSKSNKRNYPSNTKPYGWERMVFDLPIPTKTINIKTSPNLPNPTKCSEDSGAWLLYVRTNYV
jgi:hypothetical protein